MYAVIKTGGKQYKVEKGNNILVDKLSAELGKDIVIDDVLLIGDGKSATIGKPTIKGASVVATVVNQTRAPKIIVFKKRSKKGYKKTQGHRQNLTEIHIKDIKSK
ncbi:50S ribosomal protein L21 [Elusimicrobiota bacterium]